MTLPEFFITIFAVSLFGAMIGAALERMLRRYLNRGKNHNHMAR